MTYGWHRHCLLGRNISRTTANNVCIIHICPDNMWMTCTCADNMWTMSRWNMQRNPSTQIMSQIIYMILKWTTQHCCDKFHSITSSCYSRKIVQVHADHEEFCRWCADDICACRWHVDDVHACGWHADDICVSGRRADDIQMTPGLVLHEIGQLRQVCGWCADDIHACGRCSRRHMSSASRNLQRSLTLMSSARRLHIVCMSSARHLHVVRREISIAKYFESKSRALLKK